MTLVSAAKNVAILGLAALAMVLAGNLWFVSITDRTFIPYLTARFSAQAPTVDADITRPFRIIHTSGDGYFTKQYENIVESPLWLFGQEAIEGVLQSATFVGTADIAHVLSAPVIIYEYSFHLDSRVFVGAFLPRLPGMLASRGLYHVHAVALHPPQDDSNIISAFFINDDIVLEFTLDTRGNNTYNKHLPPTAELRRRYVNSGENLVFTPYYRRNFVYSPIIVTNPYNNHAGMLHLTFIRSQIEHFFDNPLSINHGLTNGIYTFSNFNTVVRYLPGNVVEYASFRTIGRGATSTFEGDFSAAVAFLEHDPHVNIEVYLAHYDTYGRETVFFFNYIVGGFPLILGEPWSTQPGCTNPLLFPIEVTVENGRVIRYRRIAYNFAPDTATIARPNWDESMGDLPLAFTISSGPTLRLGVR